MNTRPLPPAPAQQTVHDNPPRPAQWSPGARDACACASKEDRAAFGDSGQDTVEKRAEGVSGTWNQTPPTAVTVPAPRSARQRLPLPEPLSGPVLFCSDAAAASWAACLPPGSPPLCPSWRGRGRRTPQGRWEGTVGYPTIPPPPHTHILSLSLSPPNAWEQSPRPLLWAPPLPGPPALSQLQRTDCRPFAKHRVLAWLPREMCKPQSLLWLAPPALAQTLPPPGSPPDAALPSPAGLPVSCVPLTLSTWGQARLTACSCPVAAGITTHQT